MSLAVAVTGSPLSLIMREVRRGAGGSAQIARRTGLPPEQVEAGLAALSATGQIRHELVFATDCGSASCGACPLSGGCAGPPSSTLRAWRVA